MGYQESYVRVKDRNQFNELVETIKKVGADYYKDNGAYPVEIITLAQPIKGNLEYMCQPHKRYSFPEGEKFVYFVGERYLQRNASNLLNGQSLKGVEIYFTECFPSYDIFEHNTDNKYAIHEEFEW